MWDYVDDVCVHVAYLGKIRGFTCLFYQATTKLGEIDPFIIPAKDMFRFSYRVTSFKMIELERNDDPIGSFEFDLVFNY